MTTEQALNEAISGLLFTSESDEPFEIIHWKGIKRLNKKEVLKLCGGPSSIEEEESDEFFEELTQVQDWHGDEEKAVVQKYQKLLAVIKEHLVDVKVYRVGKIRVGIYIVGRSEDGDWFGVKTIAVET